MSRERTNRRFYRAESMSNLMACMDKGMQAEEDNRWTIEVAWEAANKGKYTPLGFHKCFVYLNYL